MNQSSLQNIIKAIIQGSNKPVKIDDILRAFVDDNIEVSMVKAAIKNLLMEDDVTQQLRKIAGGYQYHIKLEYTKWLQRAQEVEVDESKLPRALVETLAIIVYKQPISRGEIELLRGCQTHLTVYNQLEERGWVRVVAYGGERNTAALYGTTEEFLEYFGLSSVFDLPDLESFKLEEEIA